MKEIIKSKKRKYYYEEEKVYKCETCGAEYKDYYDIETCKICGKDICPNCDCADIVECNSHLYLRGIYSSYSIADLCLVRKNSLYDYSPLRSNHVEGDDVIPVTKLSVHRKCAKQRMKPIEYQHELSKLIQYFNDGIEWLNHNAFKENKEKEQFLVEKYTKEIERLTKRNDDYFCKINQYEEELKSNDYKKFKSLNQKQLQMLKLMNEE